MQWTWDQQVGAVLTGAIIVTFPIWSPITAIQQEVDRGNRVSFWHLYLVKRGSQSCLIDAFCQVARPRTKACLLQHASTAPQVNRGFRGAGYPQRTCNDTQEPLSPEHESLPRCQWHKLAENKTNISTLPATHPPLPTSSPPEQLASASSMSRAGMRPRVLHRQRL